MVQFCFWIDDVDVGVENCLGGHDGAGTWVVHVASGTFCVDGV